MRQRERLSECDLITKTKVVSVKVNNQGLLKTVQVRSESDLNILSK